MRFNIVAVGDKVPSWVDENFDEYIQRIASDWRVHLIKIPPVKRLKSNSKMSIKQQETRRILNSIPDKNIIIALDENGKMLTSNFFSSKINHWSLDGRDICFLIGGPDGIDFSLPFFEKKNIKKKWPDFRLSLSPLTFPHPIVRIILAEQLYRAWTIKMGHPYHR
jgi:23S rRNA (pseudouridine1915-N3)-methyltransferase|tara:strand:+ start:378 stop:872 length:495 start_codon:yes stop_codon:yes gene_type:complete